MGFRRGVGGILQALDSDIRGYILPQFLLQIKSPTEYIYKKNRSHLALDLTQIL